MQWSPLKKESFKIWPNISFFVSSFSSSTCQVHYVIFAGLNNKNLQSSLGIDNVKGILASFYLKHCKLTFQMPIFCSLAFTHDRKNCFPCHLFWERIILFCSTTLRNISVFHLFSFIPKSKSFKAFQLQLQASLLHYWNI